MAASSLQPAPRAVVTGGAGFLGSHLCERLVARGFRVTCVDNFITGSPANVTHLTASPLFTLINRDVTEGLAVEGPVEYVFHLASLASPADYLRLPVQTLRAGSIGTICALELAKDKAARFVLASSSEVYGDPLEHPQKARGSWLEFGEPHPGRRGTASPSSNRSVILLREHEFDDIDMIADSVLARWDSGVSVRRAGRVRMRSFAAG